MKKLSVVIPAYNEAKNLKRGVLSEVNDFLKKNFSNWEVLVVDDGSNDETRKIVNDFCKKHSTFSLIEEPHRGKAGAVISGMLHAKGEVILFADMDQATPINELSKFLPKFEEGYDIVIGTRKDRKGAPLVRKIMAQGFTTLRTVILRLPYKDTQCGFKAFTREASNKIFPKLKIFKEQQLVKGAAVTAGFDLEILYIARKLGLKVAEVPVNWEHKGTDRVNPIKDSWAGLRDLMKVRLNALMGKYIN